MHHQHQRHCSFSCIAGRYIRHPTADFTIDILLMDREARLAVILSLGHPSGQLHGHKPFVLTRELIPDGRRGLPLFADPHLRSRAFPAGGINRFRHLVALGRDRLIGAQVIIQNSLVALPGIRVDKPDRGIHRLGRNGLLGHAFCGVARKGRTYASPRVSKDAAGTPVASTAQIELKSLAQRPPNNRAAAPPSS